MLLLSLELPRCLPDSAFYLTYPLATLLESPSAPYLASLSVLSEKT